MKEFKYYVQKNLVKKHQPDPNTAKATARDSNDRIEMAESILKTQKPKYALENAYESVREMIDAILFSRGYKSYSHEATISYLRLLGFPEAEVAKIDRLRQLRNGIKYYGENTSLEEAEQSIKTAKVTIQKLSLRFQKLYSN